jgi:nitrile hydratase accessory protein
MNAFETVPAAFPTPWAARAFALVTAASQAGWFELREFQQALIDSIKARESAGDCIADEASYYDCWVESLTALIREKGVSAERIASAETVIRQRLAALVHDHDHDHDHDDHDREPQPIWVEPAR